MKPRDAIDGKRDFKPDHSIFRQDDHPVKKQALTQKFNMVVSKEEFGNDRFTGTPALNECNYDIFPDDEAIIETRPVFTFRNPIHEFDSWLKCGWDDLESFFIAYEKLYETFNRARALVPDTLFYTYEYMVQSQATQEKVFRRICDHWDIDFQSSMLEFEDEFGAKFIYRDEKEAEIYKKRNPKEIFTTVMNSKRIKSDVRNHGLITEEQKAAIIQRLGNIYRDVHTQCVKEFENTGDNVLTKRGLG